MKKLSLFLMLNVLCRFGAVPFTRGAWPSVCLAGRYVLERYGREPPEIAGREGVMFLQPVRVS